MTKKADTWMPFYIGAYLSDTMHLSTEQHGAYVLLLLTAWRNEGRLFNDDAQLAAICRLPPASWKKHKATLTRFFTADGEYLVQKRLSEEYQKAQLVAKRNQENGAKGGRPKSKPNESQNKPTGLFLGNPDETQSQSQLPNPISEQTSTANKTVIGENGAASPPPLALQIAELLNGREAERFGGKRVARFDPADSRIIAWVSAGITGSQLSQAYQSAVSKRQSDGDTSPVNAGLVDVFVAEMLNPKGGPSSVNSVAKAWDETASGVEAKASELGMKPYHPDDYGSWQEFKVKVIETERGQ